MTIKANKPRIKFWGAFVLIVTASSALTACNDVENAQNSADTVQNVSVDQDGTVHIPAFSVPLSNYMSGKAKEVYIESIRNPEPVIADQGIEKHRESHNELFYGPRLEKAEKLYPVDIEDTEIGGVHVEIITPRDGISENNQDRILIELHGGSFMLGAVYGGRLESMPIASIGKIKVVAVDYRQGPEYKFPAASEDVTAVYRELLNDYQPENIGIFGCSGGGVMTAQSTAWIQKEGLPTPGALGIFCAAAESVSGGDSRFWALPMDVFFSAAPPPPSPNPPPFPMAYFSDVDAHDPMVAPIFHPDVLAKFPPTLLITGTRSLDVSSVAYTHTQMAKLGVESYFYAWEGMWHAFMYDVEVPEAQEAFDVIVKFFDEQLGNSES
jgi:epsilon-lactone hydrolase